MILALHLALRAAVNIMDSTAMLKMDIGFYMGAIFGAPTKVLIDLWAAQMYRP